MTFLQHMNLSMTIGSVKIRQIHHLMLQIVRHEIETENIGSDVYGKIVKNVWIRLIGNLRNYFYISRVL